MWVLGRSSLTPSLSISRVGRCRVQLLTHRTMGSVLSSQRTMSSTAWHPRANPYPPARRSSHVDTYESASKGKVLVPDPYEWMENDSLETQEWVDKEVEFTEAYFAKGPGAALKDVIEKNTNYARFSAPSKTRDGWFYWYYNSGLQAQDVIYRARTLPDYTKTEGPGGEVFFDPNTLSDDGTCSLSATSLSKSGRYWAYGISVSGSDAFTIYLRDTSSPWTGDEKDGKMEDKVEFCKFTNIAWTHDDKGFFYQRFPFSKSESASEDKGGIETTADINAELYYHRIGTPQSEDILVMADPDNENYFWSASISELDGRYLFLSTTKDTSPKNRLWVADLKEQEISKNMRWDLLVDDFTAQYTYLANDGTLLYLFTNLDAPRYRVLTVDIGKKKEEREWKEWLGEDKNGATLVDATALSGGRWGVLWSRDVRDEAFIYSSEGQAIKRLLDGFIGTISMSGRRDRGDVWFQLHGFTEPGTVGRWIFPEASSPAAMPNGSTNGTHECVPNGEVAFTNGKVNGSASAKTAEERELGKWEIWRRPTVGGIRVEEYDTEQVWYNSKDGTPIPMFIVRHESTPRDGTAAAIQYGYGGFSVPIKPFFSPSILTFLKHYSAVLAVPTLRGGGEFGEEWHNGGIREKKVNVFDDFVGATEYLVDKGIAGKQRVAINGASNGGLLVAACVNRAPEGTFGAAVAEVGVMDMLKFPLFTVGKAWESDYGVPSDPKDFDFIYPYSPLHNVDPKKIYPPYLLLTADHDNRVVPAHSFKFAATLQHLRPDNPHPLLIRIDKKSGHGAGKSTEKRIQEAADKWGFVAQNLGLTWKDQPTPWKGAKSTL